jgi:uncharacterized membrane protein YgcG
MLISMTLLLMASSLALATPTLAQGKAEVHDPDGLPLGRHGPQKVPQSILDAQHRWIEREADPRRHEVHGGEAPARATPKRFVAPANKAAASRAAPQASDSAPAIPSARAAATKRVVPAVPRKVVVIEELTWGSSDSWLADFWKKQERQSGGGGSEGGGSSGGGGGHGY